MLKTRIDSVRSQPSFRNGATPIAKRLSTNFPRCCPCHTGHPFAGAGTCGVRLTRLFKSSSKAPGQQDGGLRHLSRSAAGGPLELAGKYLTDRYIQHNPNAASGREGVVKFFTEVLKVKPVVRSLKRLQPEIAIVAVLAARRRSGRVEFFLLQSEKTAPARHTRRRGSIRGASRMARRTSTGTARQSSKRQAHSYRSASMGSRLAAFHAG